MSVPLRERGDFKSAQNSVDIKKIKVEPQACITSPLSTCTYHTYSICFVSGTINRQGLTAALNPLGIREAKLLEALQSEVIDLPIAYNHPHPYDKL